MALTMSVETGRFLEYVSLAAKFVSDRDIVPALQYLYFKGHEIRSYSGIAGASALTPWDFGKEGFAVPGASLVKVLTSFQSSSNPPTHVQLQVTDKTMTIKTSRSSARLPLLPAESLSDFTLRDAPKDGAIAVDMEFWADVNRVLVVVDTDETRPAFRGVYWSEDGRLAGTDAKRVSLTHPLPAKYKLSRDEKAQVKDGKAYLPGKSALIPENLLSRLGSDRNSVTKIYFEGENIIWFVIPDKAGDRKFAVWGLLLNAEFPYTGVVNVIDEKRKAAREHCRLVFDKDRGALQESLERLMFFSGASDSAIRGTIKEGELVLMAGSEAGSTEETIKCTSNRPGGSFTVHRNMFKDAVTYPEFTAFYQGDPNSLLLSQSIVDVTTTPPTVVRRFEHVVLLITDLVPVAQQSQPEPADVGTF